jgi:hypothetical protein
MSQILEPPKQILKTLSSVLRNTKIEQCFGDIADGQKRCALGVILTEYYGVDCTNPYFFETPGNISLTGLLRQHRASASEIVDRNDNREQTFSEIADYLEAHGL